MQTGQPVRQPVLISLGASYDSASFGGHPGEAGNARDNVEPCASGCATKTDDSSATGWWREILDSFRGLSWVEVTRQSVGEGWKIGRWLLVAFTMEALILGYVTQEALAGTLGGSSVFAVPLAALVGLPLYLNEAGALPIVSGLMEGGMTPGAAVAFLIAGPATTVPAMAAVWSIVKPRVFALYAGTTLIGAMALGVATDLLY